MNADVDEGNRVRTDSTGEVIPSTLVELSLTGMNDASHGRQHGRDLTSMA